MKTLRIFLLIASLALFQNQAFADWMFTANLTHAQEPGAGPETTSMGAPRPLSFGTATFVLNDAMTQMTMSVTVFNIDITGSQTPDTFDNLQNTHIHVGAPPGSNASVRWGFFGTPDNDTMPKQLVITPSAVGGTFTSIWDLPEGNSGTNLTTNLPGIFAGLSYINFHTVQFGGGEIRGQLQLVPESGSTAALLGIALVGIVVLHRREKRALV